MGIMDNVKKAVQGRSGKVADAVDTAAEKVDRQTKGKYHDKLESGAGKVKDTVRKLDTEDDRGSEPEGRAAAGETAWGETSTGGTSGTGRVTGAPPPTGPDASAGTGPDPAPPTTSRPGEGERGGTGPLQ